MPVSIGPLGNQQVRVEDSVTVQSASAAGAGTAAVNTMTVTTSAAVIPPGSYWRFNGPEAPAEKPNVPVRKYHVWYEVTTTANGTLGVDPLPKETNQVGIKVSVASGRNTADVASTTAVAIEAYFAGPNLAIASATDSTDDVVVTNLAVGPAFADDGIGARDGVAASTTFTFASTTPGVAADVRTFEVASARQAASPTAASVFSLLARHTGSVFSVTADAEVTTITCPDVDTNINVTGSASFFQLRGPSSSFYVWFSASDNAGGGVATDPANDGSGTSVDVNGLASGMVASVVAAAVASSIGALTSFTASSTDAVVTITSVSAGNVTAFPTSLAAASNVDASVTVAQANQGGGDWSITRSNRFIDPDVTLESDKS